MMMSLLLVPLRLSLPGGTNNGRCRRTMASHSEAAGSRFLTVQDEVFTAGEKPGSHARTKSRAGYRRSVCAPRRHRTGTHVMEISKRFEVAAPSPPSSEMTRVPGCTTTRPVVPPSPTLGTIVLAIDVEVEKPWGVDRKLRSYAVRQSAAERD